MLVFFRICRIFFIFCTFFSFILHLCLFSVIFFSLISRLVSILVFLKKIPLFFFSFRNFSPWGVFLKFSANFCHVSSLKFGLFPFFLGIFLNFFFRFSQECFFEFFPMIFFFFFGNDFLQFFLFFSILFIFIF